MGGPAGRWVSPCSVVFKGVVGVLGRLHWLASSLEGCSTVLLASLGVMARHRAGGGAALLWRIPGRTAPCQLTSRRFSRKLHARSSPQPAPTAPIQQQQPSSSSQQQQRPRRSRGPSFLFSPIETSVSESPAWDVTGQAPKKQRWSSGWSSGPRPAQRQQAEDGAPAADEAVDYALAGDYALHDWLSHDTDGGDAASPTPAAASGGGGFVEQAAHIRDPRAAAVSAEQQLKWDSVRSEMQRSYVQQLPGMHVLANARIEAERSLLEGRLKEQTPCCTRCSSYEMEAKPTVKVL